MDNQYREKVREIRFKVIKGHPERKADLLIGQWINLKITIGQRNSPRTIKRAERELNNFFNQKSLREVFAENPKALKEAFFEEIKDSARIYQEACLSDRHYGSRLFNLLKMKPEEVAEKAGSEVYEILIPSLLEMQEVFWRNQMIAAIHSAYQEVFAENAIKAELYFSDHDQYLEFERIVNQTAADKGVF